MKKLDLKIIRNKSGQSLFEVVVAIGVVGLVVVGVVALATSSIRNSSFSRNKSLATRYTQEAIEWLRNERDTDWVSFHNNTTGSTIYCLDSLNWSKARACVAGEIVSGTILSREVTFSAVSATSATAAVTVTWSDSQGIHQSSASTVYTDWRSK